MSLLEFSFRTRTQSISRFKAEEFDFLVIGGGITGSAVARDAASRGLRVALVEQNDFAQGTSSRSSKLIHGGLRYLEKFEFGLVFEALKERTHLLKTMPHLVRPLPFYFPVFKGDRVPKSILGMGMWLYDSLSLFHSPGFHKRYSARQLKKEVPNLRTEGLQGGYRYFDAWMRDDRIVIEVLRQAQVFGAASANYVEAVRPLWKGPKVVGFHVKDRFTGESFDLRAKRVIVCAGPFTDLVLEKIDQKTPLWIKPSQGVHLVFDQKRFKVPGAVVMSEKEYDRISFVMPRPDLGSGVTIVGTTDTPFTKTSPDQVMAEEAEIDYLFSLLDHYFPKEKLTKADLISTYVGVRPLVEMRQRSGVKAAADSKALKNMSREHHIDHGPGDTVVVAGGKYTTHRAMATEIVEFALSGMQGLPDMIKPNPDAPVNPKAIDSVTSEVRNRLYSKGIEVPDRLYSEYGGEVEDLLELRAVGAKATAGTAESAGPADPDGFPWLEAQFRYALKSQMVMRVDDFAERRVPLKMTRKDGGRPWMDRLLEIWAEELEKTSADVTAERARLGL